MQAGSTPARTAMKCHCGEWDCLRHNTRRALEMALRIYRMHSSARNLEQLEQLQKEVASGAISGDRSGA